MSIIYNYPNGQFVTIKELVKLPQYSWLTEASLRHYIFQSEPRYLSDGTEIAGNGLSVAIIRIGRKILIDPIAFDDWLESHRAQPLSSDNDKEECL